MVLNMIKIAIYLVPVNSSTAVFVWFVCLFVCFSSFFTRVLLLVYIVSFFLGFISCYLIHSSHIPQKMHLCMKLVLYMYMYRKLKVCWYKETKDVGRSKSLKSVIDQYKSHDTSWKFWSALKQNVSYNLKVCLTWLGCCKLKSLCTHEKFMHSTYEYHVLLYILKNLYNTKSYIKAGLMQKKSVWQHMNSRSKAHAFLKSELAFYPGKTINVMLRYRWHTF